MRAFLAMVVGGLGLGALLRRRRQSSRNEIESDPAAELRARLAQSKAAGEDDSVQLNETAKAGEAPAGAPDPAARRQDVHERAREAIDKLR